MLNKFKDLSINKNPFPHVIINDFLDKKLAKKIQTDILNIDGSLFDSFNNPFEKNKNFSHKNKKLLPESIKNLFKYFNSSLWLDKLSKNFNISELEGDTNLYLWGIHIYKENGELEPHLDAKICPNTNREKVITLCLYLSDKWKEEYGGNLLLWNSENYKLKDISKSISPLFNKAVIFLSNEKSYHSVSKIINHITKKSLRILITMSFYKKINKKRMDEIKKYNRPHGLYKALFASNNKEMNELIKKRANIETCQEIINMNINIIELNEKNYTKWNDLIMELTNQNYNIKNKLKIENRYVYILLLNDKVIGTSTLFILKKIHNKSIAYIEDVVISKYYRKKGYCKKLINFIKLKSKELGCYKIVILSYPKNKIVYEKCGFLSKGVGLEIKLY